MRDGYLDLGRIFGISLRAHWSIPLLVFLVGGDSVQPFLWLGALTIILVHELGHAAAVRLVGAYPVAIELSGIGGLCLWQGSPSPIQRAFIAWGGVLAQGALYGVAYALDIGMQPLSSSSLAKFLVPLFGVNVFLIVINLIPIRPLDGAEAWPIIPLVARRAWNRLRRRSRPRPPERWKH